MKIANGPSRTKANECTNALARVIHWAEHLRLPQSYRQVRDGLTEEHSSSAAISRAIEISEPQKADFLQLANWAFPQQGGFQQVAHAVNQLGLQCSHDLFLAASLQDMLKGLDNNVLSAFRKHSLRCALAAHFAYQRHTPPETMRPFLEGLVAPLGILLLSQSEPDLMARALTEREDGRPIADTVKSRFGVGHQAVAAELLRYWGVPGNLVQVVSALHSPETAAPYQLQAANVNLAWHLAEALQAGREPRTAETFIPRGVWAITGLQPFDLEQIAASVETDHGPLAKALGWTE